MVLQSSLPAQTPPQAPQHPHKITQNSTTRNDPFFWLRDRSNPATLKYLNAENQFTDAVMKPIAGLQQKLYQEMRGRIQEADTSVPYQIDQYDYYDRTETGKQYGIYCRKMRTAESAEGSEEILLDGNQLAEGWKYFHLGALSVSRDHLLLAYSTDTSGSEKFLLRIKDLTSGKLLPDTIKNTSASIAWANDSRTLYYLQLDDAKAVWDQAIAAGATVVMPLKDQFWGERYGQFLDPFGHQWSVGQVLKTLSHEEIEAVAKEQFHPVEEHAQG